jgi:hypothetical protein
LLIANALQDPLDPPALRSARFTIAAKLAGVAVRHSATDPLGRRGEAITASEGVAVEVDGRVNSSARTTFAVIFNARTKQILAETRYPSDHPAQAKNWYVVFTGQVAVATDTHEVGGRRLARRAGASHRLAVFFAPLCGSAAKSGRTGHKAP